MQKRTYRACSKPPRATANNHNCARSPLTHMGQNRVRDVEDTKNVSLELLHRRKGPVNDCEHMSVFEGGVWRR